MRDTSHLSKDSKDLKLINKIIEYLEKEPYDITALEDLFSMCRHIEPIGFKTAHETNKIVKKNSSLGAVKLSSADHYHLYKKSLLFDAPHFFDDYMLYLEFDRDPDKRFYLPRRKVLKTAIVDDLQALSDDKLDLLTISLPPGIGKLISDDTPVLTTEGWKKHGDLKVGDYVYNHEGETVKVTNVFSKYHADYEVEFANGEKIKVHGEHEWLLNDRSCQKQKIFETEELYNKKLYYGTLGKRGSRYRFHLPLRKPIQGQFKQLPVDPYVLGVWLGDGSETKPAITIGKDDKAVIDEVVKRGYPITSVQTHDITKVPTVYFKKLRKDLQKVGMCHSRKKWGKRIPDEYLTANLDQRLDLLAGLMDTDGTVSGRKCLYSTTDEELRDDIISLVSTFGWRISYATQEPKLSSSGIQGKKPVYVMSFTPEIVIPTVLERKRLKDLGKQRRIALTNIRKIEPERGNCIEVEGGIYLVGRQMIPTHNSTLGIFFLSWEMGKHPMKPNLASAHSSKLTRSFYDGVYEILTDPEYLWADIFPVNRIVDTSTKNETIDLNKRQRFKTLTCRSIDGSLTGATRCENILYADDLVSGIEEALSITRLDSLWEKYTNNLKSRKKEGCKEIHIATRWSVHDPIGRLERQYAGDPRAKFIKVPALDENEESNFDYDFGVGFSTQYFIDMRNTLDDMSWRALFMNEPVEREGLVFPIDNLNRYYELPREEPDAIVAVCDTAEGGGDSVCLPVAFLYGQEVYIEDVVFDNGLPEVTKPLCASLLIEYNVQQCRFESNSAGGGFADDVQRIIEERGGITHITKKRTTANKLTKIIVNSDYIKKNFYFKDESQYMIGSPYYRFIQELTSFTQSGKNKFDDAADAMAQLSEYVQSFEKSKVEVFKRPF